MKIKEISVHELKQKMDDGEAFKLIDVREVKEFEFVNIGGGLVPLGTVPQNHNHFVSGQPVVVMCRSGKRSADAIAYLQEKHGLQNLYNLTGGILAWSDHIDPSKPKY
jgi:sulfur-carrier protein adenylyltransferase/sulfurtransferase